MAHLLDGGGSGGRLGISCGGDVGRGMFVKPGIPEYLRDEVVPRADIVTPNHFELDFLAGRTTTTLDEVLDAVDAVRATGPRHVLGGIHLL